MVPGADLLGEQEGHGALQNWMLKGMRWRTSSSRRLLMLLSNTSSNIHMYAVNSLRLVNFGTAEVLL